MSTSLLYHAFGARGYRYRSTRYERGRVIIRIEHPRERWQCSACGSKRLFSQGSKPRRFQTVPIGQKRVFLDFDVPRVRCLDCGVVRQLRIDFAGPKRHTTKVFERYVLDLLCSATVKDVALLTGLGWQTVRDIEARHLRRHFAKPKLKHVRQIAIDEVNIGQGHRYLTIVMDLESGRVLHVGEGKGARALRPFWKRLKASRARIEAVAIDMSPAYISAVVKHLPGVPVVFDRFHIMKLFNEHLSRLRRELFREATDLLQKNVLKGTRWLLLKRSENLSDEPKDRHGGRSERERLEEALSLNRPLAMAYYLKEELIEFWEQPGPVSAKLFLDDWCARARASGIRLLERMANTLQGHDVGLLNWYDHPISTGPLEGLNNKIGTLQRQSYGFRNREYFQLKILAIHRSQYALVG